MKQLKENTYKKKRRLKFDLIFFNKILFSLILAVSFYYVMNINNLSIKGFELKTLEEEVKELTEERKVLDLEVA